MNNKILQLIKSVYSNNVEYNLLGDIANINTGKQLNKNILSKTVSNTGAYPVINGGIAPSGYYWKYNVDENTITISQGGANAGFVNFMNVKFWAGAHCFIIKIKNRNVDNKFLYYFLKNNQDLLINSKVGLGSRVPELKKNTLLSFKIPIPPIKIQQEIVNILDRFINLEAELEAELEARKKQYEYYKDYLLHADTNGVMKNGLQANYTVLKNICKIYDGTHKTPNYIEKGIKFISVENIKDIYNTQKYISNSDYNNYKVKPMIGDVFMSRIGTIGLCQVIDKNIELAYYVTISLIRPNHKKLNSKYLKYLIESNIGRSEIRKRTLISATPIKINLNEIGKIKLPIPPLSEQEKIVEILNKFESLLNDISCGIPAEIKARRKQYEYYRERLLTFKYKN